MKTRVFTRLCALTMALLLLGAALPVGVGAEGTDMRGYSSEEFEALYTYEGDDLGAVWTAEATTFRVWAPTADSVKVNLYKGGAAGTDDLLEQVDLMPDVKGTWVVTKPGDLNGVYYTYQVQVNGTVKEACDPYARTTGVNGQRAMVLDLASTDP